MARIEYTKMYFKPPFKIDEEVYFVLKKELLIDSNALLRNDTETFTQHFSGIFKFIGICIVIIFLCFILVGDSKSSILFPIIFFAFVAIVFAVIQIFLEAPSFATYVKEKNEYFSKLQTTVLKSDSYEDFIERFYS